MCVCILISSSYKDAWQIELEPTLVTSFWLNYLFKEVLGVKTLTYEGGGHNSSHTTCVGGFSHCCFSLWPSILEDMWSSKSTVSKTQLNTIVDGGLERALTVLLIKFWARELIHNFMNGLIKKELLIILTYISEAIHILNLYVRNLYFFQLGWQNFSFELGKISNSSRQLLPFALRSSEEESRSSINQGNIFKLTNWSLCSLAVLNTRNLRTVLKGGW